MENKNTDGSEIPVPELKEQQETLSQINQPFIWCLIGNVIEHHLFGEDKELRFGTKHFSPNTKLYCFPILWGDGYENIQVIARHRKRAKQILFIVNYKYINNWRLQKVFHPFVLDVMASNYGWTNSEEDKNKILEMLEWLPERGTKV